MRKITVRYPYSEVLDYYYKADGQSSFFSALTDHLILVFVKKKNSLDVRVSRVGVSLKTVEVCSGSPPLFFFLMAREGNCREPL